MHGVITLSAGFLLAVLWFDLMFDVQVLPHRHEPQVSEPTLASIAAYYRRVTTTASPMGRVVALAMHGLSIGLVVQAVGDGTPGWVSAASLLGAAIAIGLAVARVFRDARRLGARADEPAVQSALARRICRDHLACLTAMTVVVVVQVAWGG